jgi:glycosyltransferase involved in cell wall biosynthesis
MCVSVFVQTLNEEVNLIRCLDSIKDMTDDIVVLDSLSSDNTVDIARLYGARVFQRPYDGRANNQNWAVTNIAFKYSWVWYVDADEVTPCELKDEILAICSDPTRKEVLFRVRFKNMLFGKWLKYSSMYPTWVARLWKPKHIRWERAANPVAIVDGPEGKLKGHFLHFSFNKGFFAWFEKHNKYSSIEAEETLKELRLRTLKFRELIDKNPAIRRQALKKLSFLMPARSICKFFFMYFLKLGFLDGRSGLTYCMLQAIYEYMICLKVREQICRLNNHQL